MSLPPLPLLEKPRGYISFTPLKPNTRDLPITQCFPLNPLNPHSFAFPSARNIYIYICVCVCFFEYSIYSNGITMASRWFFSSLKSVSIKTTLFTKMHGEDIQPALIITTSWNDWIGGSGGIFFSRLKQKASKTHCQCEIYDMYI